MHLTLRCLCGKVAHFPRGAGPGSRWTCYRCRRTWEIGGNGLGQPLVPKPSRPPSPPAVYQRPPRIVVLAPPPAPHPQLPAPGQAALPALPYYPQPAPPPPPQRAGGCAGLFAAVVCLTGCAIWLVAHFA